MTHYRQAFGLDPNFGAATASMAWVYWNMDGKRIIALGLTWDEVEDKLYASLEAAAKHPSPTYYQISANLLVRERRSDEAIVALQKAVALDPSDPWTYEGLSQALIFNGRPQEGRSYVDAAMRVDPSWTDWRHYQAGLAAFGQGRFEDAVALLEKIDVQSPDPWPKFYGLHVLLSAYGHLGRTDRIPATLEKLKAVLAERGEGEPTQLIAQHYFVFKAEADIMRLLEGLSKAGVPELPADIELKPEDRLTGTDIQSIIFGHELRGRRLIRLASSVEDYRLVALVDGSVTRTTGARTVTGTRWIQGNFLCEAYPKILTRCGAVFRNPAGMRDQQNEYQSFYPHYRLEFSVVK